MTRPVVLSLALCAAALVGAAPIPPEAKVRQRYGAWLDPDKDCTLEILKSEAIKVGVPGTPHSMREGLGKWNSPRMWQNVTGDFVATVRVAFPIPGPGTAYTETNRHAVHAAGLIVWASDDDHLRLVRQAHTSDKAPEEQFSQYLPHLGDSTGKIHTYVPGSERAGTAAVLRLERTGKKVTCLVTRDGVNEDYKFGAVEVGWGETVKVGVVAENGYPAPFEATFDEYAVTVPKK